MVESGGPLLGDGLIRLERALARLETDPPRLDRDRKRSSDPPPLCTSRSSGTTTRSDRANPPTEEERRAQLEPEHGASPPYGQFADHICDDKKRIHEADANWTRRTQVGEAAYEMATQNVKEIRVKQGIWNNKWGPTAIGLWKHEEPLELESESETDTEAESLPPSPPKDGRSRSQSRDGRIAMKRSDGLQNGESYGINTTAYENVNNTWTKRGIWNKRWGILLGMSWKHEEPLVLEESDYDVPQANPVEDSTHEVKEDPIMCMHWNPVFASPITNFCEADTPTRNLYPVQPNDHQASGATNTSHQGPSADTGLAGLENDDAERSPSALNLPQLQTGELIFRPTTGQASRPNKIEPPRKEEQPQPVASAPLSPVHLLKTSKGAPKERSGPQRRPRISAGTAGVPPPPAGVAPRRSNRIKPPVPSAAKDPRAVSMHPSKRALRSKPKRNVETRSSAKPRGTSKKRRAKTTRQKATKD